MGDDKRRRRRRRRRRRSFVQDRPQLATWLSSESDGPSY